MKAELLFILNPVAGHGRSRRVFARLLDIFSQAPGIQVVTWQTARPGHARELAARAAREGYDRVVAVGGDGTVHEIINGLMDAGPALAPRVRLGVVPAGSGNDFARNLGLPASLPAMAQLLARGEAQAIDLGRVNGRHFANLAGVGFDAEVAAWANRVPKFIPGTFTYVAGVLALLARYRNARITIELDGQRLERRAFLVAVGNGPRYAGGMVMCPGAAMNDGRLRVVICGDLSRGEIMRLLPTIYSGSHVRHPKVEVFDARQLRLTADRSLTVHADGEIVGSTPASFEIVQGAIQAIGAPPAHGAPRPARGGGQQRAQLPDVQPAAEPPGWPA